VLAILAASVFTVYIRAQRWRVLLQHVRPVPMYPLVSATAIGFGAGTVLPLRLGELIRPALLGRRTGIGLSAAISSVVVERLFDMLLVIACFVAVSFAYAGLPDWLREGAYVLGGCAAAGFVTLVLVERHRVAAERLLESVFTRLPVRVARAGRPMVQAFLAGLSGLADIQTVLVVLGYSVYLWGVITLTFLFAFLALGTAVPLVTASLATVVIVAACIFLPQGPGFVGTWQFGCVLALNIFHVPDDVAVGYSLLTWIVAVVANVGTAGIFLAREDLSLGQLLRVTQADPAARDARP
jgi:glycosyltransferase 2 family protein